MAGFAPDRQRFTELLAGEAANCIDPDERVELEGFLANGEPAEREELLRAASLAQVAFLRRDRPAHVELPAALRARLAEQAKSWTATPAVPAASVTDLAEARQRKSASREAQQTLTTARGGYSAGWYVAAALAVVMLTLQLLPEPAPPPGTAPLAVTPADRRDALLTEATDLLSVPWAASAEPGYENARGDVVWSDARQEGYLRLAGLPVNDHNRAQYQLWVVDASRDVHPVDGGVFNISSEGELIIPIQAKLAVSKPGAFAVTLEKRGGVVVSDGPMLLVAAVGS